MNQVTEKERSYLLESWKRNVNMVSKFKNMSLDESIHLARVLENTRSQMRDFGLKTEAADPGYVRGGITQLGDIPRFPDTILNMISIIYASQISDQLVSVQPLDHPQGYTVGLEYLYGDTRGGINQGDVAIDQFGAYHGWDRSDSGSLIHDPYYSSQFIEGEAIGTVATLSLEALIQCLPVRFGGGNIITLHGSNDTTYEIQPSGDTIQMFALNSAGQQTGSNLLENTSRFNPANGSLKLDFVSSATALNGVSFSAHYVQDLSTGPTNAGRITMRLKTIPILAVPHKLRTQYVFDAGFSMAKSYGVNIEESLIAACTSEIRQERDNAIIDSLLKQAGDQSATWVYNPSQYLSASEYASSFIATLFECTTRIFQKTQSTAGNWVVVGKRGLDILNTVGRPRFEPATQGQSRGAHFAGTLDGKLKVFCSPFIAPEDFLVGYKGQEFWESGFIVGDYLPIASTDFVMLDDFVGRKGFVSYYGTKMINNKLYVRGRITNA